MLRRIGKSERRHIACVFDVELLSLLVWSAGFPPYKGFRKMLHGVCAVFEMREAALLVAVSQRDQPHVAARNGVRHVNLFGKAALDGFLAFADFCRLGLGAVGVVPPA